MLAIDDGAMPARAARAARPIPALARPPRLVAARPAGSRNHVPIPVASSSGALTRNMPDGPNRSMAAPATNATTTNAAEPQARDCPNRSRFPTRRTARLSTIGASPAVIAARSAIETASVEHVRGHGQEQDGTRRQRRRHEDRAADVAGMIGDRAPRRRREQPDDGEPADEQADHLQVEAARSEVQRDVRQVRAEAAEQERVDDRRPEDGSSGRRCRGRAQCAIVFDSVPALLATL